MKNALLILSLVLGLSACTRNEAPPQVPTIIPGTLSSTFQTVLTGDTEPSFVICNDRTTTLSYSFSYTGDLQDWVAYLEGADIWANRTTYTFSGYSPDELVKEGNTVTAFYTLRPGKALAKQSPLTQATNVTDATVLGRSHLTLEVSGFEGLEPERLSAAPIAIVNNCPQVPLVLKDLSYTSEFDAYVEGEERAVICSNRNTRFSYSFSFEGELPQWRSYFEGDDTSGEQSFDLDAEGVSLEGNKVKVSYTLKPSSAAMRQLTPQGIIISPKPASYTVLNIVANDNGTERKLTSQPIPVLDECEEETPEEPTPIPGSYTSDYSAVINGKTRGIICADRTTGITISFEYAAAQGGYELFTREKSTGQWNNLGKDTPGVDAGTTISRTLIFDDGKASANALMSQSIVVTPDISESILFYIKLYGNTALERLDFEIPVAETCPD